MALKPTIYKFGVALSDMERDYYDTLQLTVAQHPSESPERLLVRVLAYCLNAHPQLQFTRGLSEPEEPDLWQRTLDDRIETWIDVGEPAIDRLRKATRVAETVLVYAFNSKADTWWQTIEAAASRLAVTVYQFPAADIQAFTALLDRTMQMSATITGQSVYLACDRGECEVSWVVRQRAAAS